MNWLEITCAVAFPLYVALSLIGHIFWRQKIEDRLQQLESEMDDLRYDENGDLR